MTETFQYLVEKYNKVGMTRTTLANELEVSISTIDRLLKTGMGLPGYKRIGSGKRARIIFPVAEVAKFLEKLNDTILEVFKNEIHPDRFLIGHANWLEADSLTSTKFYKALLKVVIEFKEIKEIDFDTVKKVFDKLDLKEDIILNKGYKELVESLQNEVYKNILK